jgi:tetratricopeptide (TPR) repeat protein
MGFVMDSRAAAELIRKLAEGLNPVHDKGVTHCDLKPGNILFTEDGTPKIADFGLAKRWGDGDDGVRGTPSYMAPEQIDRDRTKQVGRTVDVYSVGAILYECLTGGPLFQGGTFDEIKQQVLHSDPLPPRKSVPSVPRNLEIICLKCLEKAPTQRYATIELLRQDLQLFLNGQRPRARPPSLWRRGKRWTARNRTLATSVLGGALVLVLAVGAGFLYKQGQLLAAERVAHKLADEKEKLQRAAKEKAELDAIKRQELATTIVRGIPLPDPLGLNGDLFPITYRYGQKLPFKDVIVRAERIGRELPGGSAKNDAVRATVLDNLGNAFRTLGFYDKAKELLTEAVTIRRGLPADFDPDRMDQAGSLIHLAALYHERGAFAQADRLYLEAFEIRRKKWPDDDSRVTEIIYKRAWVNVLDEDFREGTKLFEEVVRLRRPVVGEDGVDVLRAKMGLAAIPGERGQTKESMERFVPLITKFAELSGDPELVEAVKEFKLGYFLGEVGLTRRQGIEALKRAFKNISGTDYLGPGHLYAAFVAAWIGDLYDKGGQVNEAAQHYGIALAIIDEIDAFGHGKVPERLGNYARFLSRQGKRAEAEQLFARLLVAHRAHFGSGEPTVAGVAGLVGDLAWPPSGTAWGAVPVAYRDASPDHFVVAAALREYARVLGEWGEVGRQEQTLRQALQILESTGGVRRQHYAPCLLDLAVVRLRQGDVTGATELLDRAAAAEKGWLERRDELQAKVLAARALAAVVGGLRIGLQ